MAEHVLLMPVASRQSGHAKETSPGRRGQVQGDCIRVRWQVHGTAAVPLHVRVEGRFEGSGFALNRISTCILTGRCPSFIFYPESTQLDP